MQISQGPYRRDAMILLAESDPEQLEWSRSILCRLGCRITLAADGQQALNVAKSRRHDAMLIECQLPRLDGYNLAERLRAFEVENGLPHCPVIGMLHRSDTVRFSRFKQAGMDAYLPKPIEFTRAHTVLQSCIKREETDAGDPGDKVSVDDPAAVREQFEILAASAGEEVVQRLVSLFATEVPARIEALHRACTRDDRQGVAHLARLLKANTVNLGLHHFADLCRDLEQEVRKPDLQRATEVVATLAAASQQADKVLSAALDGFQHQHVALERR